MRKQFKSYSEISRSLNVPKSTLSGWFKDDKLSSEIKTKLTEVARIKSTKQITMMSRARSMYWQKQREIARTEARDHFKSLAKQPLFIASTMLYWAEGDSKLKNPIRLTNTDPRMIRLYIKYLTQILNVSKEKIRVELILYPDLNEEQCLMFWSKVTQLPKSQFYKTQFIKGRHPTHRLSQGICMIILSSRLLKEKFLVWIDLLSQKL